MLAFEAEQCPLTPHGELMKKTTSCNYNTTGLEESFCWAKARRIWFGDGCLRPVDDATTPTSIFATFALPG